MAEKIKNIYQVRDDFPITDEKYDNWLRKLLNKTEEEVSENDVCTMLSQHEFEELAIKKAIDFILADPLAGEMWDGHFLEQLAKAPLDKLKAHEKVLRKLPSSIDDRLADSLWDAEVEKEEFMIIYAEFKHILS